MKIDIDAAWLPNLLTRFVEGDYRNGGVLHIILEDGNFEDHHIDFCLGEARSERDVLALAIATILRSMSVAERRSACKWAPEQGGEET